MGQSGSQWSIFEDFAFSSIFRTGTCCISCFVVLIQGVRRQLAVMATAQQQLEFARNLQPAIFQNIRDPATLGFPDSAFKNEFVSLLQPLRCEICRLVCRDAVRAVGNQLAGLDACMHLFCAASRKKSLMRSLHCCRTKPKRISRQLLYGLVV